MAGSKDVTIRAQALDGTWQVIGSDKARGVYPEGVLLEADVWGSSRASFNVRRDPTAFWPDIGAFTPVEIDVGSTLVWSGRVSDTPSQVAQRVMNVQCEGWQYHLDDDVYERRYVHRNLGAWKDARSYADCPLGFAIGKYAAGWSVAAGDGTLTITKPKDYAPGAFTRAAIVLDGGISGAFTLVVGAITTAASWAGASTFYAGSGDTPASAFANAFTSQAPLNTAYTSGNFVYAPSSPARYLVLMCDSNAANTVDDWLRFDSIIAFADASYGASFESVLKASTVVGDALDRATVLLSSDRTGIEATTFSIPEYAPGVQTPRQAWTAVDAYHDWLKQIDVNRRPIYQAKPSRPIFEVGAWSAIDDDDASANSGQEIYNRVWLTAQSPDGQAISVSRYQAKIGEADLVAAQPTNASADVNTTGWSVVAGTNGAGTLSRYTVDFDSSPASFLVIPPGPTGSYGDGLATTSFAAGTLRRGVVYQAVFAVRATAGNIFRARFGGATLADYGEATFTIPVSNVFAVYQIQWVPTADTTAFQFRLERTGFAGIPTSDSILLDSVSVGKANATIVDRRNFRRSMILPVQSALPSDEAAAQTVADLWLTGHRTTPFKGSTNLTGGSALRSITTGADVGLEQLLLNTGQLIRFSDRSDPDSGGHGRDGRIAAVSYQPATDSASVTIDSSRTNFPALLARLAVIQGG